MSSELDPFQNCMELLNGVLELYPKAIVWDSASFDPEREAEVKAALLGMRQEILECIQNGDLDRLLELGASSELAHFWLVIADMPDESPAKEFLENPGFMFSVIHPEHLDPYVLKMIYNIYKMDDRFWSRGQWFFKWTRSAHDTIFRGKPPRPSENPFKISSTIEPKKNKGNIPSFDLGDRYRLGEPIQKEQLDNLDAGEVAQLIWQQLNMDVQLNNRKLFKVQKKRVKAQIQANLKKRAGDVKQLLINSCTEGVQPRVVMQEFKRSLIEHILKEEDFFDAETNSLLAGTELLSENAELGRATRDMIVLLQEHFEQEIVNEIFGIGEEDKIDIGFVVNGDKREFIKMGFDGEFWLDKQEEETLQPLSRETLAAYEYGIVPMARTYIALSKLFMQFHVGSEYGHGEDTVEGIGVDPESAVGTLLSNLQVGPDRTQGHKGILIDTKSKEGQEYTDASELSFYLNLPMGYITLGSLGLLGIMGGDRELVMRPDELKQYLGDSLLEEALGSKPLRSAE